MSKDLPEFMKHELSEISILYYAYRFTKEKGLASIYELKRQLEITDERTNEFWQLHHKLVERNLIEQQHPLFFGGEQTEGFVHLTNKGYEAISEFIDTKWIEDRIRTLKTLSDKYLPIIMSDVFQSSSAGDFYDMNINETREANKLLHIVTFKTSSEHDKIFQVIIDPATNKIIKKNY